MARVVDFCPTSDDEVPELGVSPRKLTAKHSNAASTLNKSPQRQLVPKSATKSVNRKFRRLETNPNITGNLLFQRCNDAADNNSDHSLLKGSPRKSPLKKSKFETTSRSKKAANESIFESEDDSPPATVRKSRASKLRTISILEDDESDSEPLPAIRMNPLLKDQTPGLRRVQLSPGKRQVSKQSSKESVEAPKEPTDLSEQFPIVPASLEVSDKDESSQTGEESSCRSGDGSSYSMDSFGSDFTYDESSQATGNDSNSTSFSTEEPEGHSQVAPAPSTKTDPALAPIEPNRIGSEDASVEAEPESCPLPHATMDETQSVMPPAENRIEPDGTDLSDKLSKLLIHTQNDSDVENEPPKELSSKTPPHTPSKPAPSTALISPSKLARIPKTPHRPSTDAFWNQDVTDGWNDKHSPRKLVLPAATKSPAKTSPSKGAKKAFDQEKHEVAEKFLQELDAQITEGKIFELAESTGGVKLEWSRSLNTTAGRANWKRETIRTKKPDGSEVDVKYKHHASIELAEKVIDDENRLLNVLAHEFCHLANFMITGITNNPHGKEFKVWASKCSRAFASRGVKVTTKHTYEIDFKYIWECSDCGSEYKRHSKSIDPSRHRCGSCKATLKQVKPVPRGGGKPSEYQLFVKEQMKIVKQENPGIPQKEIMKLIAAKWASRPKASTPQTEVVAEVQAKVKEEVVAEVKEQTAEEPAEEQAEVEAQLAAEMGGLTL